MIYVLYAGMRNQTDGRLALAGGIVAGESVIFAVNGFRCPLSAFAETLGAQQGSVTDIYLPAFLAHNLPAIHAPLIALAALLNGRNLRRKRRRGWD